RAEDVLVPHPRQHPDPHSFPTRRSSDLIEKTGFISYFLIVADFVQFGRSKGIACVARGSAAGSLVTYLLEIANEPLATHAIPLRSEELTSELQSRFDLACRLLLEHKHHA